MICRVRGCTKQHMPDQLACRSHWFELPKAMRDEIWRLHRNGPEDEHREACFSALEFLNRGAL